MNRKTGQLSYYAREVQGEYVTPVARLNYKGRFKVLGEKPSVAKRFWDYESNFVKTDIAANTDSSVKTFLKRDSLYKEIIEALVLLHKDTLSHDEFKTEFHRLLEEKLGTRKLATTEVVKVNNTTVIDLLDEWVEDQEDNALDEFSSSTKKVARQLRKNLETFGESHSLAIASINKQWVKSWIRWMISPEGGGLCNSTYNKRRNVLIHSFKRSNNLYNLIHLLEESRAKEVDVLDDENVKMAPTLEEIVILINIDFSEFFSRTVLYNYEIARDFMLLSCLVGARYSEFFFFERSNITSDMNGGHRFFYKSPKNNFKLVSTAIGDMAVKLLNKYDMPTDSGIVYTTSKGITVECPNCCFPVPKNSQKLNERIQNICKLIGLFQLREANNNPYLSFEEVDELVEKGCLTNLVGMWETDDYYQMRGTTKIKSQKYRWQAAGTHMGRRFKANWNLDQGVKTDESADSLGHSEKIHLQEYVREKDKLAMKRNYDTLTIANKLLDEQLAS